MRRRTTLALSALVLLPAGAGCSVIPAEDEASDAGRSTETTAVVTADPVDPWLGRFDDRAAGLDSPVGASWGTFGPEDAVVPTGWTHSSLEPGNHTVTIECDGAAVVTVGLAPSDQEPGYTVEHDISCPGGAILPFTTESEGLAIGLDSHGEPGAYLVAVDVNP